METAQENEILKLLRFTENKTGVFRANFERYSRKQQTAVFVGITIECVLILIWTIFYRHDFFLHSSLMIVHITHGVVSEVTIIVAWYHSDAFHKLEALIQENDNTFKSEVKYMNNLNSKCKLIKLILISLYFFAAVSFTMQSASTLMYEYSYKTVLFLFIREFLYIQHLFQMIVICNILFIISEQVKCISRSCDTKDDDDDENINYETIFRISTTDINNRSGEKRIFYCMKTYVNAYTTVKQSCEAVNLIFNLQFLTCIANVIVHIVFGLFQTVALLAYYENVLWYEFMTFFIHIGVYMISFCCLCSSAQGIQESVTTLQRILGRNLNIHLNGNTQSFKETKSFLRYVLSNTTKIQTFGSINIDMSLIPKVFMFVVTYTVIILQFNNVI